MKIILAIPVLVIKPSNHLEKAVVGTTASKIGPTYGCGFLYMTLPLTVDSGISLHKFKTKSKGAGLIRGTLLLFVMRWQT